MQPSNASQQQGESSSREHQDPSGREEGGASGTRATEGTRPPMDEYNNWAGVNDTGVYEMLHTERALPHVPAPVHDFLDSAVLFCGSYEIKKPNPPQQTGGSTRSAKVPKEDLPINLEALQLHLLVEGTLTPDDGVQIADAAKELLQAENNVLTLDEPITVVGDIHGQFYDLIKLLEIGGDPAEQSYLFLGDYVDRGCFSCECVLYLLSLKVCYPKRIHLLRGNHEGRHLTSYFSFKAECYYKYSPAFYDACMSCFDLLPLAATVGDRYFCVHGGLSPEVMHIEEINYIQRDREIPTGGAMCDLLWSDPHWDVVNPVGAAAPYNANRPPTYDFATSSFYETDPLFTPNQARGCSFIFNFASLHQFLQTNHRLCVIRAHEAQEEGYQLYRPLPNTHFPSMISLFSAPNYCDSYNNKGAILTLKSGEMAIKQFYSSPHPYVLPNFMNGIEWSLPFVLDKLSDFIHCVHELVQEAELEEDEELMEVHHQYQAAGQNTGGIVEDGVGLDEEEEEEDEIESGENRKKRPSLSHRKDQARRSDEIEREKEGEGEVPHEQQIAAAHRAVDTMTPQDKLLMLGLMSAALRRKTVANE